MGYHRAFELLVLGEQFDAQRAYQAGLVNRVVAAEEVEPVAMAAAKSLAAKPPEAVRTGRRLLRGDRREVLARIDLEATAFTDLLQSPAARDALEAFLNRHRG
jgi:enoyl-CoA hydratase/carnithine racemase